MENAPLFLWPDPAPPVPRDFFGAPLPVERVEERLRALHPGAEPVLFSSARAGLSALLVHLGLARPDLLWTPAYSSHCVLDAVARHATPTPHAGGNLAAALVYHQWGHAHRAEFPASATVIEDAVDTFLLPGRSPFALAASFALWSPPKVLGTLGGGVVFCREEAAAENLRALRAARPRSVLQALLRRAVKTSPAASRYWNGAEAAQGDLVTPLRRQFLRFLERIDERAAARLALLRHLAPDLAGKFEASGRLPSNLPLRPPSAWEKVWGPGGPVASGLRSFNAARSCPEESWVKVAPFPVHSGVSAATAAALLQRLSLRPHELEIV